MHEPSIRATGKRKAIQRKTGGATKFPPPCSRAPSQGCKRNAPASVGLCASCGVSARRFGSALPSGCFVARRATGGTVRRLPPSGFPRAATCGLRQAAPRRQPYPPPLQPLPVLEEGKKRGKHARARERESPSRPSGAPLPLPLALPQFENATAPSGLGLLPLSRKRT